MDIAQPPFTCSHTPEIPELLAHLDCSLLLSTYQAGKILVLSSDGESLNQLPRTFDTPMGLAYSAPRLAVATKHEVILLANDPRLGWSYPRQPEIYDSFFAPRSSHFCGQLNIHDLAFTPSGELVGVNTLFSCLFRLDQQFSFVPTWQPPFISTLAPEDRCHLNGMALENGVPRYVTALGKTDSHHGWRENKLSGGVLIDVETNELILSGLAMPHSPRIWDDELYLLLSATGELIRVDVKQRSYDVVCQVPAFARGMARMGDYVFVGCSRLRKTHTFGDLPLAQDSSVFCGVLVIHLPTGSLVGKLEYVNSCEEIYDVQVLPGLKRPGILNTTNPVYREGLSLPDTTYWGNATK